MLRPHDLGGGRTRSRSYYRPRRNLSKTSRSVEFGLWRFISGGRLKIGDVGRSPPVISAVPIGFVRLLRVLSTLLARFRFSDVYLCTSVPPLFPLPLAPLSERCGHSRVSGARLIRPNRVNRTDNPSFLPLLCALLPCLSTWSPAYRPTSAIFAAPR